MIMIVTSISPCTVYVLILHSDFKKQKIIAMHRSSLCLEVSPIVLYKL